MAFRDESEALRARVDVLERELGHAQREAERARALERELAEAKERLERLEEDRPEGDEELRAELARLRERLVEAEAKARPAPAAQAEASKSRNPRALLVYVVVLMLSGGLWLAIQRRWVREPSADPDREAPTSADWVRPSRRSSRPSIRRGPRRLLHGSHPRSRRPRRTGSCGAGAPARRRAGGTKADAARSSSIWARPSSSPAAVRSSTAASCRARRTTPRARRRTTTRCGWTSRRAGPSSVRTRASSRSSSTLRDRVTRVLYFGLPLGALCLLHDGHELAGACISRRTSPACGACARGSPAGSSSSGPRSTTRRSYRASARSRRT
ncbi:MAG: hypothetical protein M5U28_32950 [Sandaracinaceae bacterium]|nr:hypothetical protein [Sandaracinaceae bacterium]